jgi:adenylate cyclase
VRGAARHHAAVTADRIAAGGSSRSAAKSGQKRARLIRRIVASLITAAVVTALAVGGLAAGAFDGFQRRAADALFPSAKADPRVAVVGMDRASIRALGIPPWPRSVHAQLAQRLAEAGAEVVVWDVVFLGERAEDLELAAGLREVEAPVLAVDIARFHREDGLYAVDEAGGPGPTVTESSGATYGHVLVTPDPSDGVVRMIPLVVDNGGTLLPSLALQALRALRGEERQPLTIRPDGVQVGDRLVPTEEDHLLRLNFASGLDPNEKDSVISAVDVLDGKVGDRVRGKVVLIGATDPTLGDVKLVPVDKSDTFPGVMIHANALNTMLASAYLAPEGDTSTAVWIALLTLIVALAVLFLPVWLSPLVTLVIAAGYLVIAFVRFDGGRVMNLVYPFAAIVVAFVIALGIRYLTETRRRRRVSSLFAQYVPEAVARELEESGDLDEHVEGERIDVSLFFCDLRGFTTLSATLEPPQVRSLLNRFYELVTDAILTRGGTVMKFVGDEVFAVFGAPLAMEDHAQRALECAIDIQERVPGLDATLAEEGIPAVGFGIGLNSGEVVAAHVGTDRRRQYDVVGDTVNLASRLCGQARAGAIVLPEAIVDRLTDPPEMESIGAVELKGLDVPVRLMRIVVGGPAVSESGVGAEPEAEASPAPQATGV